MTNETKALSLERDGDGFLDQDGMSWDSPREWFFSGVLGGCRCGNSDVIAALAVKTLVLFGTEHEARTWCVYDNLAAEVIAHWMDSGDLLGHGTSVGESYLTPKGEGVLAILRKFEDGL